MYPYRSKIQEVGAVSRSDWIEQVGREGYDALLDAQLTGAEVTVVGCSVDNLEKEASYYDIKFDSGLSNVALHALHLVTLPGAGEKRKSLTHQFFFELETEGKIDAATADQIEIAVLAALRKVQLPSGPTLNFNCVVYETSFPTPNPEDL